MKAELAKLLELFSEVEERGGCASLSLSTSRGKSTFKFTLETPPSAATSLQGSSASPITPGNQARDAHRCLIEPVWIIFTPSLDTIISTISLFATTDHTGIYTTIWSVL